MQSLKKITEDIGLGKLSAREALERCFAVIDAHEASIGAFVEQADRPALLAAAEHAHGPLAGIALGVKDIVDTADLPTAYGSPVYRGHQPRADAALVAIARRAGALVVGKTVTTEFAYLQPAGTRNPSAPDHTPGGSSSGSAAAGAAGMVPAAIGSQTGGSVIRPASFCGVTGFKPSFRLLPVTGMKAFAWTLDTAGLFAAGVEDVALLASALSQRNMDIEPVEPRSVRIGLYRTSIWNEADEEMQRAVERAATLMADKGARVIELEEPPLLSQARGVHGIIQDHEAALALAGEFDRHSDMMSATLREALERGKIISTSDYDTARRIARHARKAATALFDEVDVLLTPSAPGPAPAGLGSTGGPSFNKLWTMTGNPCLTVPGLASQAGLPLGIQLVGRFGRDRTVLGIGNWLQKLLLTKP
jgi:Asp-tRNA(Asn)/Glu-tRNA(Gln) amidotransferase A subunit family amidase